MPVNESKLARSSLNTIAPNNSDKAHRDKSSSRGEERKKLKPIVKGPVIKQKKTIWTKVKNAFIGDSQNENLGDFILYDIFVPAFRDTLGEMGYGIIGRLFGTEVPTRRRSNSGFVRDRGRSYISYNSIVNDNRRGYRDERRDLDSRSRARHDFDNIVYTSRGEAEDVLAHLVDMTIEYGEVTVRSFYELSNIAADHTDERYGWTNLRDAYVDRTRNGHVIVFPPTRPL